MIRLLFLLVVSFFFVEINAQEKSSNTPKEKTFKSGVGVVDMKKILQDSTAYQALVDQFEEREENIGTSLQKLRMLLEMKKANYLNKRVYFLKKFLQIKLKAKQKN